MINEETFDILGVALNDLAFRSLNNVPYEPGTQAEATELLADRVRQGSLFIGLALCKIADAIERANESDH